MYTHIFINVYIFLYLWSDQQTNQNVYNDPTHKKIGATHQRKDAPILLCLFIIFKRPSRLLEDYVYIFKPVEVFHKVSCYESGGHIIWFIEEQLASCLDLRHGPRICQKFMNVIIVYIRQCRRHGTTIHAQDFIQSQGKT